MDKTSIKDSLPQCSALCGRNERSFLQLNEPKNQSVSLFLFGCRVKSLKLFLSTRIIKPSSVQADDNLSPCWQGLWARHPSTVRCNIWPQIAATLLSLAMSQTHHISIWCVFVWACAGTDSLYWYPPEGLMSVGGEQTQKMLAFKHRCR